MNKKPSNQLSRVEQKTCENELCCCRESDKISGISDSVELPQLEGTSWKIFNGIGAPINKENTEFYHCLKLRGSAKKTIVKCLMRKKFFRELNRKKTRNFEFDEHFRENHLIYSCLTFLHDKILKGFDKAWWLEWYWLTSKRHLILLNMIYY